MSRKRSILLAAALGVATAIPVGVAQSSPAAVTAAPVVETSTSGSYVVVMQADPLLGEFAQGELNSKAAKKKGAAIARGHAKTLERAGVDANRKVQSFTNAVNGFSAVMSHDEAVAVALQKGVAFVAPDELRQLTTDESADFLGLDDAGGIYDLGYDGDGVVVGVIDSGIWPEHPSVADDGSYSAPPISLSEVTDDQGNVFPACDFGGGDDHLADGLTDDAFSCNNKLIGARHMMPTYLALSGLTDVEYDSARDEDGHGTHTATTAAGNADVAASVFGVDRGSVTGVAPRAHVVAYKALGTLGGYGSDLAGAIDQAVADGVDVINYSIGSTSFAIGPDDVAFMFAADAGVHVATSAGNSGPDAATLGSPSSVPWLTTVGASTHSRTFEGSVTLGDGASYFGASITGGTDEAPLVDAEDLGNPLCLLGEGFSEDVAGKIVLCQRGAVARIDKSLAVYEAGGAGMVLFNTFDADSEVTDNHWVPSVHINFTDGSAVKTYIDDEGAAAVAEIGAGEYTTIDAPWMAAFSSRGENLLSSDIIKPDVTAPGVNILAGNTPTPTAGAPGQLYQSISGTSMSSPHVAGLMALIDQAHPDWSPAAVKSALMTTAYTDVLKEDGATPADPFDMGAGHVDPSGAAWAENSLFNPGIVYDAGLFEYAGYSCGADLGIFSSGDCAFLEGVGVPSDPSDFNQASIGIGELAGSQTVVRTISNVSGRALKFAAEVDAPAGYSVTVSPAIIHVPAKKSATFQITITNDSAPVGEWAFGSMTLVEQTRGKGKAYSARSPIAVRGVTLAAPSEVSGTIAAGGTSFDIDFGYTGSYTAAAHGLAAAATQSGTVFQDDDQTFSPADQGVGATLHTVDVTDAAFLRIHVPPVANPDTDLDLFVYGPDLTLVGSSGNGGTNETVDILLPPDGTYYIFIHGWGIGTPGEVPPASADYTFDTFAVPLEANTGSLDIVSAPASAELGTVGTVEVSWPSDLASGNYLGAVSHTTDDGLAGLTLVAVDG
ncbi:MAG: S8 family serine peptidase [Ilumatobacteraceae bacterium]|nr:S8 family serine peptidase [Ilumatobacteraceae bacterium]